jgi:hypothetical protein
MTTNKTKDTNDQQNVSSTTSRSVAYENEMHRLTQLSAYLLAEADGFKQSPLDYWLLAEKELYFGY